MSTTTEASATPVDPVRRDWFSRRTRNLVLTVHIVVSVGLLGDSAGFLAVAVRRALSEDPAFADASLDLLGTFAIFFGIPLSFLSLLSGIALGLGTRWGVFRYPWVIAKLSPQPRHRLRQRRGQQRRPLLPVRQQGAIVGLHHGQQPFP